MLHFLTLGCTVSVLQIHRSLLSSKLSSGAETTPALGRGCPAPSAPRRCGVQGDTAKRTRGVGWGPWPAAQHCCLLPSLLAGGRLCWQPGRRPPALRNVIWIAEAGGNHSAIELRLNFSKKELFYSLPAAATSCCQRQEGTWTPKQRKLSQNCPPAAQQLLTRSAKLNLQRNATQWCLHWGEAVSCSQGTECSSSLSNLKNCFYAVTSSIGHYLFRVR